MLQQRKKFRFQFGNPEQLESRSMMAGHALSSALAPAARDTFAVAASAQPSAVSKLAAASKSSSQEVHLGAALADPNGTATGSVSYESEVEKGKTKVSFVVQVRGAAPSSTLDVAIDGAVVGQITTDVNGAGRLSLSSNPKGSKLPLPANFPATLAAGAIVTAGTTTGTLAGGSHDDDDDGSSSVETHLGAALTDPNSSATGKAEYESETEHGKTKTKFEVEVRGAVAGSVLDVAIDGTVVGQITVDAKGRGKLVLSSNPKKNEQPLPANFPASLPTGSVVTVGSLSGSLAIPTKVKK